MYDMVVFTIILFFSSLIQACLGFAGALVAIPLFAILLSVKEALPSYHIMLLFTPILPILEGRSHIRWKTVFTLAAGGVLGIPLGAVALKVLSAQVIGIIVSVATLMFALLFLFQVGVRLKETRPTQVGIGFLSGLLGGCIGQAGPPVVIYGLARQWTRDAFRATLLTYFLILSVVANLSYIPLGLFSRKNLLMAAAAIIPTFLSVRLGIRLKNRIREEHFRRIVLIVIFAMSLIGLIRHLA